MRNRIARACSVLAAGIAVTSVIGFSAASMASASVAAKPNATPACGFFCFNLYSRVLGDGTIQNAYVPGDTGVGGRVHRGFQVRRRCRQSGNQDRPGASPGRGRRQPRRPAARGPRRLRQ